MNTIVLAPDGTFIDISKVSAITCIKRLSSDFKIRFGFDIYFNPEGVPFKQDNSIIITIYRDYDKPHDICLLMRDSNTKESAYESFKLFVEKCRADWEIKRLDLVEIWKTYKK